jgi:hypothetical protein
MRGRRRGAPGRSAPRGQTSSWRTSAAAALAALGRGGTARGCGFKLVSQLRVPRRIATQARGFATNQRTRPCGASWPQRAPARHGRGPSPAVHGRDRMLDAHAFEHGFALSYPPASSAPRLPSRAVAPSFRRPLARRGAAQHGWTLAELFRARPDLGELGDCADCPLAVSRAACDRVTSVASAEGPCSPGATTARSPRWTARRRTRSAKTRRARPTADHPERLPWIRGSASSRLRAIAGERPHAGVVRLGTQNAEACGRGACSSRKATCFGEPQGRQTSIRHGPPWAGSLFPDGSVRSGGQAAACVVS